MILIYVSEKCKVGYYPYDINMINSSVERKSTKDG